MAKSIAETAIALARSVQPVQTERQFSLYDIPALCTALRAGDETAFSWLYQMWGVRINRYCFVLAKGDSALCAEIAQAVWIRLSRSLREVPNETALWNWIACAARHSAIDLQRGRMRHARCLMRFWEWFGGEAAADQQDGEDADELLARALENALAKLSDTERSLLERRYFEGSTLEQIATESSLSDRAVEGRLARLRARLRLMLEEELDETVK